MVAKGLTRFARYEHQTLTADSGTNQQSQKMEYPQITQISALGSCRAKRTGRAGGVPQLKSFLSAASTPPREAALHGCSASKRILNPGFR
jgi:hypothetical protein